MLRDFRLYLDDILDAVQQIRIYLADLNEEAFTTDRKSHRGSSLPKVPHVVRAVTRMGGE